MKTPLVMDLLRHGETTKGRCFLGRTDAALTKTGWSQMEQALHSVIPSEYDLIISSPLLRCKSFAQHWLTVCGYDLNELRLEPAIREYDFGDWDGLTAAEIMQEWPVELGEFWRDPEGCPPPQGELISAFFERLKCFIKAQQQGKNERVLLITHGGVIKALTCLHQERPASDMANINAGHGELHRFIWNRQ